MANFFYVKSGGTASAATDDGRVATTPSTGSFATKGASAYYNNVDDALNPSKTNPPTAGDFICVSDVHSHDYATNQTLSIPDHVTVICVSDTNCDTVSSGAIEGVLTGSADLLIYATGVGQHHYHIGMDYRATDDIFFPYSGGSCFALFRDCTFTGLGGAGDGPQIFGDGNVVEWINTDVKCSESATAHICIVSNGQKLIIRGGSVLANSTTDCAQGFLMGGNGGQVLDVRDFDMSNLATSSVIVDIDGATDDTIDATFHNCLMPTSYTLTDTPAYAGQRVAAYGCDTGGAYYSYQIEDEYGSVVEDTSIYRDAARTYDGTNRLSLKVTPNSNQVVGTKGLRFPLGSRYADIATANKTVTVYFIVDINTGTVATLDKNDIVMYVSVQDDTNRALSNTVKSHTPEPLKTGVSLTAGSLTEWTGETGGSSSVAYELSYDLGAFTNASNAKISVEIELMCGALSANEFVYIDPDFDITNT